MVDSVLVFCGVIVYCILCLFCEEWGDGTW